LIGNLVVMKYREPLYNWFCFYDRGSWHSETA